MAAKFCTAAPYIVSGQSAGTLFMSTLWRLNFEMVPTAWKVYAHLIQLNKLSEITEF